MKLRQAQNERGWGGWGKGGGVGCTSEQLYSIPAQEMGTSGQSGVERDGNLFIPGMCPTGGWCSEGEAPA